MKNCLFIISCILLFGSCKKEQPGVPSPITIAYFDIGDESFTSETPNSINTFNKDKLSFSLILEDTTIVYDSSNNITGTNYKYYLQMNDSSEIGEHGMFFYDRKGEIVGPGYPFQKQRSFGAYYSFSNEIDCPCDAEEGYMRIRMKNDLGYNYGWMLVENQNLTFTIKEFAII